jgi:hypothetical protein
MSLINNLLNQLNFCRPYKKWSERKNVTDRDELIEKIRLILNHLSGNDTIPMLNDIMHTIEKEEIRINRYE